MNETTPRPSDRPNNEALTEQRRRAARDARLRALTTSVHRFTFIRRRKLMLLSVLPAVLLISACGAPTTCAEGTTRSGSKCVSSVVCAEGTTRDGDRCVPAVACAPGQTLIDGVCSLSEAACGPGTVLERGRCVVASNTQHSSWSQNLRVCARSEFCSRPRVSADSHGHVYLSVESGAGGGSRRDVVVFVSADSGATFTEQARFTSDEKDASEARIASSDDGHVWVVFRAYHASRGNSDYGSSDIMVAHSNDFGSTFGTPTRINPDEATDYLYDATLAHGADGVLAATWERYVDQRGTELFFSSSSDNGVSWSVPTAIGITAAYGETTVGAPVQRAPGQFTYPYQTISYTATYELESVVGVFTVTPTPGADASMSEQTPLTKLFYASNFRVEPAQSLAVTSTGRQCFVYSDAASRNQDIYAITSVGPLAATKPTSIDSGPGTQRSPSSAAGALGRCHAVWQDNSLGAWRVMSSSERSDGTWSAPEPVSDVTFTEDVAHVDRSLSTALVVVGGKRYAVWEDLRDELPNVRFAVSAETQQ